jgi:2-phospho-L-lactate guanylyltransferase
MAMTSPAAPAQPSTAVVIPVKSFDLAKGRLAEVLDPERRAELARSMATGVVQAAAPLPVFVVCGSDPVAAWAAGAGAEVIRYDRPGLNLSVAHAARVLTGRGFRRLIVAHGDLPLARSLSWVAEFDGVTIVPDRRGGGTNVMAIPLGVGFDFHYGEGSAALHRTEAERRGLRHRTVPDDELGWDVDTPDDLDHLELPEPCHLGPGAHGRGSADREDGP